MGIGAVGILVYVIGIPLGFLLLLKRYAANGQLQDSAVVAKLGFLYAGYQSYFWVGELVEMTRKMLLSGLTIFVAPGTAMQIVVALFLSMGFLLMHSLCDSFEDDYENRAQIWALRGAALTVLTGLLIMSTAGTHEEGGLGTEAMTALLLFTNFIVFLVLLFVVMEVWYHEVIDQKDLAVS